MGHDQKENAEEGERIAALATWTVLVLMMIKGTTGLILGSIALVADAVHSFAESVSENSKYFDKQGLIWH